MSRMSDLAIEIQELQEQKDSLYAILAKTTNTIQCKKLIQAILDTKNQITAIYRSVNQ